MLFITISASLQFKNSKILFKEKLQKIPATQEKARITYELVQTSSIFETERIVKKPCDKGAIRSSAGIFQKYEMMSFALCSKGQQPVQPCYFSRNLCR